MSRARPSAAEIVCAGHACLDLIPEMFGSEVPGPGVLTQVGPAVISTGGSVSNTGLALHRMGIDVRLVSRVGDDSFGGEVRRLYNEAGAGLAEYLQSAPGESTSYSVVISPTGGDRRFLHCSGTNDTFTDDHVPEAALTNAKILHFGYPPAMRAMCANHGEPLVRLFRRAKAAGLLTSLDLCGVDTEGWPSTIDWLRWLQAVLPHTDVFLPGRDELATMTDASPREVLSWGCQAIVVKDGHRGLSIHTDDRAESLGQGWGGRSLEASTFIVDVVGTTGAGDTTIAGFLAGLVRRRSLEHSADLACAAGAFCVQAADATSGLRSLDQLQAFIDTHPPRRQL